MNYRFISKFLVLTFRDLTLKNVIKQSLISIMLIILLSIVFNENHTIFQFIVFLYLFLSGSVVSLATKFFFTKNDLKMLGFEIHTFEFNLFYIIQRYFRDTFITNSLVFIGLEIFLIYQNLEYAVLLLLVYSLHFILSPIEHLIFFNNVIETTIALVIKTIFLIGFSFLTVNGLTEFAWLILVIFYVVYTVVIYSLSFKVSGLDNNFTDRIEDKLRIIKKVDLFLFRDLIFMYKPFFSSLVNLVLFLILFADRGKIGYYLIFILTIYRGLNSFFIKKDSKKEYILTISDKIFWDEQLKKVDIKKVKIQKLNFSFLAWFIFSILGLLVALILHYYNTKYFSLFILISFVLMISDYLYMVVKDKREKKFITMAHYFIYGFFWISLLFVKELFIQSVLTTVFMLVVIFIILITYLGRSKFEEV